MNNPESIGNNIRLWLKIKDIKQENLARELGISTSAVSQIINSKINITFERKIEIAELLKVTTSQLDENPLEIINYYLRNFKGGGKENV
jgi:transcriptional regulator with XRE-family HTH domain